MSRTLVRPGAEPRPAATPASRTIRIALAGCGTVGGALIRLLRERAAGIEAASGLRFEVARILVRDAARPRPLDPPAALLTTDLEAFLATDADVVVEALGGLDPAERIARRTLAHGRGLVTANKALVAAHGPELAELARRSGAAFAFEAAVAGGVPVVRVLRDSLLHAGVRSVRGVLNGTTNYILTRMSEGVAFPAALAEAQARGFAEADPVRDLDGRDAADKIAILAWWAFGPPPRQLPVSRRGLLPDPDALVAGARAFGGVIRLLAECALVPGGVTAAVEPVILPPDSRFARVAAEENLVVVETAWNGTVGLSGPGAGGGPTASAVLSDLVAHAAAPTAPPAEASDTPGPAPALAGVRDPRSHRWALTARGSGDVASLVAELADEAGVGIDHWRTESDGPVRAATEPATREQAWVFEQGLAAMGVRAGLVRLDG